MTHGSQNSPARKLTLALAAFGSLAILLIYSVKIHRNHDYTDFLVYHRNSLRASLHQWSSIYNLETDGNSPYRYAPVTLPWLHPLSWFSYDTAKMLWFYFQFACYALGFRQLHQALKSWKTDSNWVLAATILFVFRFCIDSFTIGQITGLMFLFFTSALSSASRGHEKREAGWLLVPTLLKLGPGVLYLRMRPRAWAIAALWLLAMSGIFVIYVGSLDGCLVLCRNWVSMLRKDSAFFDAAHYGSQSINSALLRLARTGWLHEKLAMGLGRLALISGVLGILWLWRARRAATPHARGLFFGLGVFAYLLFMPFTFKYSLPLLAIPVAAILSSPHKSIFDWMAFVFGAAVLSLAGLDIIGPRLFFGLQKNSFPLLAMLLLFAANIRQALVESERKSRGSLS